MALSFAGGSVEPRRPTRDELIASAQAWLAMAQTQTGKVGYFADAGDRPNELAHELKMLRSQLAHAVNALAEIGK